MEAILRGRAVGVNATRVARVAYFVEIVELTP
jgi:hypothetical protein